MNFSLNSPTCGLRLCSILAGLGGLAHLVRLFRGFRIAIGRIEVPVWASAVALVVLGLLSYWLWKLSTLVASPVPPPPPQPPAAPPPPATPTTS